MRVIARVKAKQGFRPSFPGYMASADVKGTLVAGCVVLPPGPTTNNLAPGEKAPWVVIPLSTGMFEYAKCDEDPTPALLGQQQAAPAPKPAAKTKEV
jgi:hypothetical protein